MSNPFETTDGVAAMAQDMFEPLPANDYLNLAEFVSHHVMQPGYDYREEFEYGLDLILNGVVQALAGQ